MKRIFVLTLCLVATALIFSCGSKNQKSQANNQADVLKNATAPVDIHNARNSLDYMGKYHGVILDAYDNPIAIYITLEDSTYILETSNSNKSGKFQKSVGKYSWNDEGNTIKLEGEDIPNQYFVKENALTQRDLKTDSLYVFNKQP